ncbi:hypothetical protein BGZ98_009779 [Dissophora globulifera]|nr:hypothetical protein BGZ98_009779 [Dissophora globulifera]
MSSKDSAKQDPPEVAEFQKELHSLFDSRTASASKIDRITKLAIKSARYYKNIVYSLEKFITRCVPEYKLTGLYVLDSICRTSQSVKHKSSSSSFSGSEYVGRFERNIEALFAEFCKVQEDKEKERVKRVVDLWERSGTFSATVTETIKKKYFPLLETSAPLTKDAPTAPPPAAVAPAQAMDKVTDSATESAASFISSLAASLAQNSAISSTPPVTASNVSSIPSYIPTAGGADTTYTAASNGQSNNSNSFLAGISDPSSALALQTLLATVSQVKAVTAAATAGSTTISGGGLYQQPYPSPPSHTTSSSSSSSTPPTAFQPSGQALPPVLQQLQGVLSNSNQNGTFLSNNNTMVSSTVASPYLHSDAQQGGRHNEGSMGGMGSAPGHGPGSGHGFAPIPRDPRVDPRLALQKEAQESGAAQPLRTQPPSQPPADRAQPPQLPHINPGPGGFDGLAMAQLASFLNPMMNGAMPPPPLPSSMNGGLSGHGSGRGPGPAAGVMPGMPMRESPHHDGTEHGHGRFGEDSYRGRPGPMANRNRFDGNSGNAYSDDVPSGALKNSTGVKEDSTVGADQIRVLSRTLWVGGTFVPTISEPELEGIFSSRGTIATLMVNHAKFNAFIKMADRAVAERCKVELDRTTVHGEVMKVGWGCGFGPRDCFDYTTGASVIPLERLTDTDRRWLSQSVVGGFGLQEPIRGGVTIVEPNIEAVAPDGREALPKKGKSFGGDTGGGIGRGGRGGGRGGSSSIGIGGFAETRGRGRGRGLMDHQPEISAASPSRGRGGGRGRGFDDHAEQWSHPLPSRPQTTAWGRKRDFGQSADEEAAGKLGSLSQHQGHGHQAQGQGQGLGQGLGQGQGQEQGHAQGQALGQGQGESDEARRSKKSRWE